jgi:2'-5' RNA ligase
MPTSPVTTKVIQISQTLRVFIALELPQQVSAALEKQVDDLRAYLPGRAIRWVRAEGIHLTLKFLGDVPSDALPDIKAATESAASGCGHISLRAEGLGCFPDTKRPRVVWLGLKGQLDTLQSLRDQVEARISPLGYPTEKRPFSPHLTLGRLKSSTPREVSAIGKAVEGASLGEVARWTAQTVSIMQSTLRPDGAIYTALAKYSL